MIVVIDTETSGLHAHTAGLVELGAVLIHGGELAAEWSSLCWPGYACLCEESHWKALGISGIPPALLLDAPPVEEAMRDFARWLGAHFAEQVPVTSFNVAFDRPFVERAAGWTREVFDWRECLMLRAQRALGLSRWPKLSAACEAFGIAQGGEHRALDDARSAARLWLALEGSGR